MRATMQYMRMCAMCSLRSPALFFLALPCARARFYNFIKCCLFWFFVEPKWVVAFSRSCWKYEVSIYCSAFFMGCNDPVNLEAAAVAVHLITMGKAWRWRSNQNFNWNSPPMKMVLRSTRSWNACIFRWINSICPIVTIFYHGKFCSQMHYKRKLTAFKMLLRLMIAIYRDGIESEKWQN